MGLLYKGGRLLNDPLIAWRSVYQINIFSDVMKEIETEGVNHL